MKIPKKIRTLIVGDDWVSTEHLIKAMEDVLKGYDYEITTHTIVMDKPMSRDKKEDIGDDTVNEYCGTPQEIIDRIDGINLLVTHTAPITKQVIDAGKELVAIGCCRSDIVNINVDYATEKGIYLFNAPGRSVEPVSDITITFALTLARNILRADEYVKSGRWYRDINRTEPKWDEFYSFRGPVIKGKKFGILGLGKIGKRVADKAKGIGFDVQIFDPFLPAGVIDHYGKNCTLEELISTSDFITIHVPPVESNQKLIDKKMLGLMKNTAYLINVARGEIIDEIALIEALKEKQIAGAALDVFWKEPLELDSELMKLDNVILTPHIAGQRYDVSEGSADILREQMLPFYQEKSLKTCINMKDIK
ncbi:D-3-phosphoglycerate dehydrogenase [Anaerovirgula multivorans]|uniref:D-3-phosphoglycerate dehydrogenase n=1 Tax=Anaerovirgula multivorans TaxID=312168 RepID=A0A239D080_9FIRM|nr:NAD(P)-dependent oxidoreductase [Anaerovirgula multivorans]SNS25609.1 D-3-phosphoglycerate dehydrogenase [Anaerovirgula multivorans]